MKPTTRPRPVLAIRRETLRALTPDMLASVAGGAMPRSKLLKTACFCDPTYSCP